ncbi:FRIGIDA-LIKE PROTEIN [Salix koriyanagi]|uniref:FRIGIDA-like protein n=1 Tax=Salix koriyanagi TaxID=2511006 RepID=A0A9Q0SMW8_9ROSI|nr:FRIGIDA-LIKE PROTEIN [Salix koriyanagi]
MTVDNQHCLDVLGFFFLLASYGLASAFDSDELISRLVIIARNRQTPEFLRVLELGDKIPGFIQNLILKKQPMEAIRFIFAFEMVYRFPPEAILRDYLTCSKIAARKIRWSSNSIEGLVESLNRRVSDLVAVLKCVEDYKLESIFSPNTLKQQIKDVERQLSMRKTKLPDLDSKSPQPNPREKNRLAPKSAASAPVLPSKSVSATPSITASITASTTGSRVAPPSSTSASPSASVPKTDPPYHGGNKRRQARYQGSDKPPREQHQGGDKRPRIQRLL